ncbi:hypothetical protein BTA51_13605 [Hahella sp. CCB-MM4]|uniref:hypothetical protein n=1 Tax=Hahella sp. (strain CCB-MM4) TaxID=1926491 RepID=UPI000B9B2D8A|nr:hypothetical protein [Hahella sp. CCB-MM4]OZG72986.1 hypothetical protein BTA51_13605 [Hahella sp. CCB-MM4]
MDRPIRKIIAAALCSIAVTTNVYGLEITSDVIKKSQDGVTVVYIGNVELTAEDTRGLKISSVDFTSEDDQQIYEGDVKISLDAVHMLTDRAVVTRQENGLRINMDQVTTFER